jgi:hypothetical protein
LNERGTPSTEWTEEDYRSLLENLFDLEQDIARGSNKLRVAIKEVLGRIVVKRVGYYLDRPDEEY